MHRTTACCLTALAAALSTAAASTAEAAGRDPRGVWINDSGRGAVEIKDCGESLCGHVVWTRDASDTKGCGRQIIGDAAPSSSDMWTGGWIYNPEAKRKYDVELKPLADGTLRVTGFAGTKLLSKTMIWKAAPPDLERCSGGAVEANAPAPEAKPKVASPAAASAPSVAAAPALPASPPPLAPAKSAKASGATKTAALKADPAPAPATKPSATADETAADGDDAGETEQETADAGDSTGDGADDSPILDRLKDLKLGKEYGLHEIGNGKCRLKMPFVTLTVDCQ